MVAALGPRRALIAQGRWRQLFKEPGCPDLAAYLAARYDSLMVGLRRWGCELATVDGIPALNAYGHRVLERTKYDDKLNRCSCDWRGQTGPRTNG